MGIIKNQLYKDFKDGFDIKQIDREDIITVIDNIDNDHRHQARAMVILAWATGARPNEYLRLTPGDFSTTKQFVNIKMPGSKGSAARMLSLPRFKEDGSIDELTKELHDYIRKLAPSMFCFFQYRSTAVRRNVTKKYKNKAGENIVKEYDKCYEELGSKLRYYFARWFDVIVPGGIPPYYLRHNRATIVLDTAGREATIMHFGWKAEATLKKYAHSTKKMREQIAGGLMK